MTLRVAMLIDPNDCRATALCSALNECSAGSDMHVLHPWTREGNGAPASPARPAVAAGATGNTLLRLLTYGPHLVICADSGARAFQAALYRSVSRQSRLLLCAADAPIRAGALGRWVLSKTDAVLADGDAALQAVKERHFPAARIFTSSGPTKLGDMAREPSRSDAEARRLLFVGDLSPQSGAADCLISVAAWAEQTGKPAEIWWAGNGDLAGVLDAQPLPPGVTQRFLGRLDQPALASVFRQCGILVVPSLVDERQAPVAEAFAAGLPVLGSRLDRKVRQLVHSGVNGWLFDARKPADMAQAIASALDCPAAQLDRMRAQAQALVRPEAPRDFAEQFARAVAAIMPERVPDVLPRHGLARVAS